MQLSSSDSDWRTKQSKVAYYSPRSENHQKVTPEQRKNCEMVAQDTVIFNNIELTNSDDLSF